MQTPASSVAPYESDGCCSEEEADSSTNIVQTNNSRSTVDALRRLFRELNAVPVPTQYESPSSWFTRFSLSQGVSVHALSQAVNLSSRAADFDLHFASAVENGTMDIELMKALQPSVSAFRALREPSARISFRLLYPFTTSGRPRAIHRFCRECLAQSPSSSFHAHWRFQAYRVCINHGCLLEDCCRACRALVMLPFSPTIISVTSSYQTTRVASLAYCRRCGASLLPHSGHGPKVPRTAQCSDDTLQRWSDASNRIHRLLCTGSPPIDLEPPFDRPPPEGKPARLKQPSRPSMSLLDSLPYPVRLTRRTV